MKIIFFGTPEFSAKVLEFLLSHRVPISAIVTKPDRPVGRGRHPVPVPVKALINQKELDIPLFQPEIVSSPAFYPILKQFEPDLFVVVAYGEILKTELLEMPVKGCINLHASLLPKYRGAAPIQRAIIAGEKESGVTIMHMAKKMDAGDIIETGTIPITEQMTYGDLQHKMCEMGAGLLLKTIQDFERGVIKRVPQDHSLATYAPKIELEDCEIKWDLSAIATHNLIRGVNPEPGAWAWIEIKGEHKRLKIYTSQPIQGANLRQGDLSISGQSVTVGCALGAIELLDVQLEGKKRMKAADLFRGLSKVNFTPLPT
ncbi:MAG: methionyl-tRNA formyltransferase [Parachlamydiaceae bacterium]